MAKTNRGAIDLRAWLAENDRSQAWLATKVGVKQSQVARWLSTVEPKASHAAKIADITGIPCAAWGEILSEEPRETQERQAQ